MNYNLNNEWRDYVITAGCLALFIGACIGMYLYWNSLDKNVIDEDAYNDWFNENN